MSEFEVNENGPVFDHEDTGGESAGVYYCSSNNLLPSKAPELALISC